MKILILRFSTFLHFMAFTNLRGKIEEISRINTFNKELERRMFHRRRGKGAIERLQGQVNSLPAIITPKTDSDSLQSRKQSLFEFHDLRKLAQKQKVEKSVTFIKDKGNTQF